MHKYSVYITIILSLVFQCGHKNTFNGGGKQIEISFPDAHT